MTETERKQIKKVYGRMMECLGQLVAIEGKLISKKEKVATIFLLEKPRNKRYEAYRKLITKMEEYTVALATPK